MNPSCVSSLTKHITFVSFCSLIGIDLNGVRLMLNGLNSAY